MTGDPYPCCECCADDPNHPTEPHEVSCPTCDNVLVAELRKKINRADAKLAAVWSLIPMDNPELIEAGYSIAASDLIDALSGS